MIYTTRMLKQKYKHLANPNRKIASMFRYKELYKLCRGLYSDTPNISGLYVANAIYGPSYISFDTALSFHNMIPERIFEWTSATCTKNKSKSYQNFLGTFTYHDIPLKAFPFGVELVEENGYQFAIASKEKALCDKLYSLPPLKNIDELSETLLISLRIDQEVIDNLNKKDIKELSTMYRCKNIYLLNELLIGGVHE